MFREHASGGHGLRPRHPRLAGNVTSLIATRSVGKRCAVTPEPFNILGVQELQRFEASRPLLPLVLLPHVKQSHQGLQIVGDGVKTIMRRNWLPKGRVRKVRLPIGRYPTRAYASRYNARKRRLLNLLAHQKSSKIDFTHCATGTAIDIPRLSQTQWNGHEHEKQSD